MKKEKTTFNLSFNRVGMVAILAVFLFLSFSTTQAQELWTWGSNDYGQLANGSTKVNVLAPAQIGSQTNWIAITTGSYHTMVLKSDHTLWGSGYNVYGELGDGTTVNKTELVQIGTGTDWAVISAKMTHTVALKSDGTLWVTGENTNGQLGDGTTVGKTSFTQIETGQTWKAIAGGQQYTLAVKSDGTLWTWGYNANSQLGDGTTTKRSIPTQVGTATDWVKVSAGASHALGLKSDGTLWAWGYNNYGQIGDGTTGTANNKKVPTQIGTDTNWAQIFTGSQFSLAIKTDGTLWTWGYNGNGQLGDGTTVNKTIPTQIGTDTDWATVSAGLNHTLAIKTDGALWAWGSNASGQLGDGTTSTGSTVPVKVGTATDWKAVAAGTYSFSIALKGTATSGISVDQGSKLGIAYDATTAQIKVSGVEGDASLAVYNLQGEALISGTTTGGTPVSAKSLSKGIYVVKVVGNGESISKKIVVQ
ncbi:MAG: C-terminal target protein [Bacteroidetes bacterium]|nr:C-terminal target protein [Bacteroidota bacterium]